MGNEGGSKYDLTEIFVIKFVLADVIIIFALIFAGPIYALAITALLVASVVLVWYALERAGTSEGATGPEWRDSHATADDPVTTLQNRYAAGELSESEFETRLDQLIDANERADRAGIETRDLAMDRTEG